MFLGEIKASDSAPTWWIPPVDEEIISSLLLWYEYSRRISSSSRPSAVSIIDETKEDNVEILSTSEHEGNLETTGISKKNLFVRLYRWEIDQNTSGSWTVTEQLYLYPRWRILYSTMIMSIMFSYLGLSVLYGALITRSFILLVALGVMLLSAVTIVTILVMFLSRLLLFSLSTPTRDWDNGSGITLKTINLSPYKLGVPYFILILHLGVLGSDVGSLSTTSYSILGAVSAAMFLFVTFIFMDWSLRTRIGLADLFLIENEQYMSLNHSLILCSGVLSTYFVQKYIGLSIWQYDLVFIFIIISVPWTLWHVSNQGSSAAVTRLRRDYTMFPSKPRIALNAGLTSFSVWVGILSVVMTLFDTILNPSLLFWDIRWYVIMLISFSYLAGGLVFQSMDQVRKIRAQRQLIDTRPTLSKYMPSFQRKSQIDVPVIVVNSNEDGKDNGKGAQAVRLPGDSAILLSAETIASLNDDELRAVLAHEESHLRRYGEWIPVSDAFIRLIGPFVGTVFGLPQSAVYAFCGFRRREYRADQYAKERTSAQTLLSAIDKLAENNKKDTSNDEGVSDCSNAVSNEGTKDTLTREAMVGNIRFVNDSQQGEGLFYPVFSPFTITAHPLLEERKEAINPDERLPESAEDITLPEETLS